jgi:hypothetical protein
MLMRARVGGGVPTDLIDGGHKRDEYVGTLIWSPGLKFATLPPFPQVRSRLLKSSLPLTATTAHVVNHCVSQRLTSHREATVEDLTLHSLRRLRDAESLGQRRTPPFTKPYCPFLLAVVICR